MMRFSNLPTTRRDIRRAAHRLRAVVARLTAAPPSSKVLGALTPMWPVGPYRYSSIHPGWHLTVLGALCGALVLQHVASLGAEGAPRAAANEVISPVGAGGNSIPGFLEPPPVPEPPADTDAAVLVALTDSQQSAKLPSAPRAVRGIPATVLAAYQDATDTLDESQPDCHLTMPLLAAIGRVESGHAHGGNVDAAGTTRTRILGPRLDGAPGIAAIRDTDGGVHDGDTVWDRAVGPMQFIPSTWRTWGSDGNDDGISDPNNVFDATLAAGRYLCAAGRDLATADGPRRAVLAYNHSEHYLNVVLSWMKVYAGGAVEVPNASRAGTSMRPSAGQEPTSRQATPEGRDKSGPQRASGPGPRTASPEPRSRDLSKPPPTSSPPPDGREADKATDKIPVPRRLELPPVLPTDEVATERESATIG